EPTGNLTRDNVLDNITVYWLTGTGASAARSYWERAHEQAAAAASGQAPPQAGGPVAFTQVPGGVFRAPRSWVERGDPSVLDFNRAERGGHFAAWEEPQLFAEELRAAFATLRQQGRRP